MKDQLSDESFYDILKVDRHSTVAEIVNAYHTAKNTFSRDSIATYSLFSPEEKQSILDKLEEAYQTLSNTEKKRDYDRKLSAQLNGTEVPPQMTELEIKQKAQTLPHSTNLDLPQEASSDDSAASHAVESGAVINGHFFQTLRERRGLSLEDVSRITKIPSKFIRAIESDSSEVLPARVYLQGFVKNLAALYKLNAVTTTKAYLDIVDSKTAANQ